MVQLQLGDGYLKTRFHNIRQPVLNPLHKRSKSSANVTYTSGSARSHFQSAGVCKRWLHSSRFQNENHSLSSWRGCKHMLASVCHLSFHSVHWCLFGCKWVRDEFLQSLWTSKRCVLQHSCSLILKTFSNLNRSHWQLFRYRTQCHALCFWGSSTSLSQKFAHLKSSTDIRIVQPAKRSDCYFF